MKRYFDISRFWLLLKLELYRSRKGLLIALDVTFGMLFFFGLLFAIIVDQNLVFYTHHESYAFTLIIGGFVMTSLAFNDLGSNLRRYNFLTLPVSALERFLCMWLLTSVGWIVFFSVVYALYTLAANQIGGMLFSSVEFVSFDPISQFALLVIHYYLVTHGIFLVGAVYFRGYVFPKTLFTLITLVIVFAFMAYFILGDVIIDDSEFCLSQENRLDGMPVDKLWQAMVQLFWWALAPICWVLTYVGLKDQEV